ncbi:MAG TPA: ATP-binding protein, partial [Candidatus Ozemobacteraceae bacterium]|nr:ATP-binding protein [Candidatus Ozemobacteraceae bacterium]
EEMTVQLLASQNAQRKAEAEAGIREGTIQVLKTEIARRQKAEEDLRAARDRAEAGNIAKSNFLAMVSHELRTPLTAVIAYGKLLADEKGPLGQQTSPDVREFGNRILKSGEHLQGLIDNILSYSELETGQATLKPTLFELESLIEFLEWFVGLQQSRSTHIAFELQRPQQKVQLYSDLMALRQILINVLSNAFKFTHSGKVQFTCAIEDTTLRISVIDTGIGIPAAQREQLFQPFFQVSSGKRRRYGGAGVGLAIVKHLVDSLHGSISIDSEEGRGTTVTMTFPDIVRKA